MREFAFSGVAVAAVTPFAQSGQLDAALLRGLIAWWLGEGVEGVVLCGSTGEMAYLAPDERLKLFAVGVEAVRGRVPVVAGTGYPNTRETLYTTRAAEALGVDAAMVVTPYYYPLDDEALLDHYRAVAEATALPVLVYNMPPLTHVHLSPEQVGALARIEGVAGIKDSAGDLSQLRRTLAVVPPGFCTLTGSFPMLPEAVAAGAAGAILAMANLIPAACVSIAREAAAGRLDAACDLRDEFDHLQQWIKRHGIPGIKHRLAEWHHPAGWPRAPLRPLRAR